MSVLSRRLIGRQAEMSQLIELSCSGFEPTSIPGGIAADITVTAFLFHTEPDDQRFDWAITVDGSRIGTWTTTTVRPFGDTDTHTATLPAIEQDLGGSHQIGIQQRFGFQQTAVCGTLDVGLARPTLDEVNVTSCGTSTGRVDPGESTRFVADVRNDNQAIDAVADIRWDLIDAFGNPVAAARVESAIVRMGGTTTVESSPVSWSTLEGLAPQLGEGTWDVRAQVLRVL